MGNKSQGSSTSTSMRTVLLWTIGVATIALVGLVMLILFGNLSGNVGFGNDGRTITTLNETSAYANITGYTLANVNSSNSAYAITAVWNVQGGLYNVTVPLANVTVSSAGVLTNGTVTTYANISVSYTHTFSFPSDELTQTDNFIGNYTQSVVNTGIQFPVVGTIIGIALLLLVLIGILVFAVRQLTKMDVSGSGSGGSFG